LLIGLEHLELLAVFVSGIRIVVLACISQRISR
jgi:hypothetical protein